VAHTFCKVDLAQNLVIYLLMCALFCLLLGLNCIFYSKSVFSYCEFKIELSKFICSYDNFVGVV